MRPVSFETVERGDADGRERLYRYVLRHPLSLQRLSWTADGRIAYIVKYPRSPKHTHLPLEPVQFMARVASLNLRRVLRLSDCRRRVSKVLPSGYSA